MAERDDQFSNRADAHIRLSHQQALLFGEQKTAESMLYGAAWYNAWLAAKTVSRETLEVQATAEIDRLTQAFRQSLETSMADVIARYDDLHKKS